MWKMCIRDSYRVIEEGLCGRTTVFDDPFRTERRGTEMLPAILESHRPVDTIVPVSYTHLNVTPEYWKEVEES